MPEPCCGDCRWCEPNRNPETGRIRPSYARDCRFPVKWPPKVPSAYWEYGARAWYAPRPMPVWPGSGRLCPCFEPKGKKHLPLEEPRDAKG